MTAAFQQFVKQQLAVAKRDYAPGSPELKAAEQAYVNAGGVPGDVAPAAVGEAQPQVTMESALTAIASDTPTESLEALGVTVTDLGVKTIAEAKIAYPDSELIQALKDTAVTVEENVKSEASDLAPSPLAAVSTEQLQETLTKVEEVEETTEGQG